MLKINTFRLKQATQFQHCSPCSHEWNVPAELRPSMRSFLKRKLERRHSQHNEDQSNQSSSSVLAVSEEIDFISEVGLWPVAHADVTPEDEEPAPAAAVLR